MEFVLVSLKITNIECSDPLCKYCDGDRCSECLDKSGVELLPDERTCGCKAGTYYGGYENDECVQCPLGTHNPEAGKISIHGCKKCQQGWYAPQLDSPTCNEPCHKLCKECYGPGYQNCLACFEILNMELTNKGTCSCQKGYYYDPDEPKGEYCQPCGKYCIECEGALCSKCESMEGINLVSGVCECGPLNYFESYEPNINKFVCSKCPDDLYPDFNRDKCLPFDSNCETCSPSHPCLTCITPLKP